MKTLALGVCAIVTAATTVMNVAAQERTVTVPLTYRVPTGDQPKPNFSPKGTQVTLADVPASFALPAGAQRPAKVGRLQVGPDRSAWIPVLATATPKHRSDLVQIYLDRDRDGQFTDEQPLVATPSQNEKTKAWWSSFNETELKVRFTDPVRELPYSVSFWIVREDGQPAPDVLRYSRRSWVASAPVTVNGVQALVAAMDGNNDALYGPGDSWSVVQASMPNAATAVLSLKEARDTSRMMFLERGGGQKDLVLEFRSFARDGSSITFAVVDKPVTKAEDRLADDSVAAERSRTRTKTALTWSHNFDEALATAKASGKRLLIDFETTWCGPCKTMDEWIWTDAEVAGVIDAGFVGVKLDGDIEKALVKRFGVGGYPTMVIVNPADGSAVRKVSGYQTSAQMLTFLKQ
jgi:thiol-disulfide isomerase/thioredoxin